MVYLDDRTLLTPDVSALSRSLSRMGKTRLLVGCGVQGLQLGCGKTMFLISRCFLLRFGLKTAPRRLRLSKNKKPGSRIALAVSALLPGTRSFDHARFNALWF